MEKHSKSEVQVFLHGKVEDDVWHLRFQYPCRGKAATSGVCCACRVHHGPHSGVHWAKEGHGDDNSDASLSGSDSSNMI